MQTIPSVNKHRHDKRGAKQSRHTHRSNNVIIGAKQSSIHNDNINSVKVHLELQCIKRPKIRIKTMF